MKVIFSSLASLKLCLGSSPAWHTVWHQLELRHWGEWKMSRARLWGEGIHSSSRGSVPLGFCWLPATSDTPVVDLRICAFTSSTSLLAQICWLITVPVPLRKKARRERWMKGRKRAEATTHLCLIFLCQACSKKGQMLTTHVSDYLTTTSEAAWQAKGVQGFRDGPRNTLSWALAHCLYPPAEISEQSKQRESGSTLWTPTAFPRRISIKSKGWVIPFIPIHCG